MYCHRADLQPTTQGIPAENAISLHNLQQNLRLVIAKLQSLDTLQDSIEIDPSAHFKGFNGGTGG